MNKSEFATTPEVVDFVEWSISFLPTLEVNLNISNKGTGRIKGMNKLPSTFGPGVKGTFVGMDAITNAYQWAGKWEDSEGNFTESCDWFSTRKSLNELSKWFRGNIQSASSTDVFNHCNQILIWGGDRNPAVGAGKFLLKLQGDIQHYLITTKNQLLLKTADISKLSEIFEMNAMLTKVHALASDDGLPIYDSRVAGAIACLIEIYRQNTNKPWNKLPDLLTFKAVDNAPRRRVIGMNHIQKQVIDPGRITRETTEAGKRKRSYDWASSKVRLGWLMEEIIHASELKKNSIFKKETLHDDSTTAQLHALEAALFMIGFDVNCISKVNFI
ncbi:hypothetical protein [Colwellia sp. 12G3]|uniref:hypothetical protein n=1 Tax=Colwellia sp. 12G3 TaxID=2058299 RepID=UPI000C33E82E|nr:hypothetical protein [Colwellia sp. 12G3]PKI17968.1 hypothetical protein CXF71_01440 [Colwellia sp. 12G3]